MAVLAVYLLLMIKEVHPNSINLPQTTTDVRAGTVIPFS